MFQIALDGPPGSGKSTLGKALAKELGIMYLDSGAFYRTFALHCIKLKINTDNLEDVKSALESFDIKIEGQYVELSGEDVSEEIRKQYVSDAVRYIASNKDVRLYITDLCRKLSAKNSVVMDGRDISTNILPNAQFKYFVIADINSRAERRFNDLKKKGVDVDLETVKKSIENRENIEKTRPLSPLVKHPDAIIIDSSNKTVEELVTIIKKDVEIFFEKIKR